MRSRSIALKSALATVTLAATACLGGWSFLERKGDAAPAAVPAESDRQVLCAPGLVEPASQVLEIRAPRYGRLVDVAVTAGATVEAGQVVASIDHDQLQAVVGIRTAEVEAASCRLALLEAGPRAEAISAARCRLAAAEQAAIAAEARSRELESGARPEDLAIARARLEELQASRDEALRTKTRHGRLVPSGAMEEFRLEEAETALAVAEARVRQSAAELARLAAGERSEVLDRVRADASAARARVEEAKAELASLENGSRTEDLAAARAEIEAARARLAAAAADLSDAFLRSPIDGLVVYRYRHPGEEVGPEDRVPVLEIATAVPLHVRADVDEFDIGRVYEGQRIYATAPAFGYRRFQGRVVRLERILGRRNFKTELPTEKRDAKILEVVVALDAGAEGVLPLGMPVRVFFLAESEPASPAVPAPAGGSSP